jgi:hypothetical protein
MSSARSAQADQGGDFRWQELQGFENGGIRASGGERIRLRQSHDVHPAVPCRYGISWWWPLLGPHRTPAPGIVHRHDEERLGPDGGVAGQVFEDQGAWSRAPSLGGGKGVDPKVALPSTPSDCGVHCVDRPGHQPTRLPWKHQSKPESSGGSLCASGAPTILGVWAARKRAQSEWRPAASVGAPLHDNAGGRP